ncbi:MAG: hypothetical protein JXR94_09410, partial [Candidatus Hydrogenedentes bacterium]|nr:hypothetical protein [Candidatus Hydrogenedentota bacterium]
MPAQAIHRFEVGGKRFAVDIETCFCFECDEISWDVLAYYPHTAVNRIYHELSAKHDRRELEEVVGELEWLRATRAILRPYKREDFVKRWDIEQGLKRMAVRLPREATASPAPRKGWFGRGAGVVSNPARELGRDAAALLLARSATQKDLTLEFIEPAGVHNPDLVAGVCAHALKQGALAGKSLTAAVYVPGLEIGGAPAELEGHTLGAKLEFTGATLAAPQIADALRALGRGADSLARLAKALQPALEGVAGRIVVQPNHPAFAQAVEALDKAGFNVIELDLDGSLVANPALDPE